MLNHLQPPRWLGESWLAPQYIEVLCSGLVLTTWLSLLVCIAATLVGTLLFAMIEYGNTITRTLARLFISLHRNTPLMVQLLLWYFGFPNLLPEEFRFWLNTPHSLPLVGDFALTWPSYEFLAALIGLSLYSASFIAGELTSGLRAIHKGQREAAQAIGLTSLQELRWILLPQILTHIRQPLISQYTGAIKNTSLAMAVGVAELSYRVRQVENESLLTFQAFAVATALYLLLILTFQWFARGRPPRWKAVR